MQIHMAYKAVVITATAAARTKMARDAHSSHCLTADYSKTKIPGL